MNKIKVFLHPYARPHVHDGIPGYENLVPFSKQGLEQHCELIEEPASADIVYCGQLSDEWLKERKELPIGFEDYGAKNIIDIEGDWLGNEIPVELFNLTLTINGARNFLKKFGVKHFVRPTFSTNFVDICRSNKREGFDNCVRRSFGFKGFPDPHGIRLRLREALSLTGLSCEYKFTEKWNGPVSLNSTVLSEYVDLMLRHSFSLCPRGAGHDSVRFYESCYYGRVPVVVGDNILFEDEVASRFTFKINTWMNAKEMAAELLKIASISDEEIIERGKAARSYFDTFVRAYMADPTGYFLRWLEA